MESSVKVFEQINSAFTNSTMAAIAIFVAASLAFLFVSKRKTAYYRKKDQQLYLLLLAFTMLIALGMGVFSWFSTLKMREITVSKEAIVLPDNTISLKKIKNAYIYLHLEKSGLSSNIIKDTVSMLILEEKSGKTHAISAENYDVDGILETLRENTPQRKLPKE